MFIYFFILYSWFFSRSKHRALIKKYMVLYLIFVAPYRTLDNSFVFFSYKNSEFRFERIFLRLTYCLVTYGMGKLALVDAHSAVFRSWCTKAFFRGRSRTTFSRNYLAQFSTFGSYLLLPGQRKWFCILPANLYCDVYWYTAVDLFNKLRSVNSISVKYFVKEVCAHIRFE